MSKLARTIPVAALVVMGLMMLALPGTTAAKRIKKVPAIPTVNLTPPPAGQETVTVTVSGRLQAAKGCQRNRKMLVEVAGATVGQVQIYPTSPAFNTLRRSFDIVTNATGAYSATFTIFLGDPDGDPILGGGDRRIALIKAYVIPIVRSRQGVARKWKGRTVYCGGNGRFSPQYPVSPP